MDKSWAVKIDATIVDVKAIGAPIGGRKPTGAPRDGDGDGICWESTTPRPCPPGVPSGTRLPKGFTAAERAVTTQRQRAEIADITESRRIKMRVSQDRIISSNPDRTAIGQQIANEAKKLIESSRKNWANGEQISGSALEALFKDAYKMRSLGSDGLVRTARLNTDIKWWEDATPGKIGYLEVYVRGDFFKGSKNDPSDRSGWFGRTYRFYAGTGEVEVDHDNLFLDGWANDVRGGQVGSDFANISNNIYEGIGVSSVELDAAHDGSYAWAVAGYDWRDEETKEEFLNEIEYRISRGGYFASKDKAAIIDLLAKARKESEEGLPRTVTPYSFTVFSSSRKGLNDILWSGRLDLSKIAEMPDLSKSIASAVKETKEIVGVKKISRKALRRIRDFGRGPGSGLDGDGDGLTDDGTPWERPAVPRVLERVSERWGRGMDEYLERRRDAAKRVFKRESKRQRAKMDIQTIQAAIDSGDDIEMRRVANVLFAHEGLGTNQDVKSKVKEVQSITLGGQQVISVEGIFVDDSGQELGYFIRDISPLANAALKLTRPGVAHQELKLEDISDRGLGIGLSFGLASEFQYKRAGLEEIALQAGLDNGVYTWARDGFDWSSPEVRQDFLSDLLRGVNASNTSGALLTDEEKKMYRDVIQQAMNERFDDDERLRPIHFSFMPKFNKLQQAIKSDPAQGVARLNWYGRRKVRDYSSLDPSAVNAEKIEVVQSQEEMFETVLKTAEQWRKKVGGFDDFNEPFQQLLRARERWGMSYSGSRFNDDGFFDERLTEDEWKLVSDFLKDYAAIDYLDVNGLLRSLSKNLQDQPPLTAGQLTSLLADKEETAERLDSQALKALGKYGPPTSIIVSNPELFDDVPRSSERLFRGQYSEEDLFRGLKVGDVIADDAFISTSMDVDSAINFAGYELTGNFTELVESEIELYGQSDFHRAIMVIKPSSNAKVIPGDDLEREWILPPGTMFRIAEMKRWDDPESAENSFTYVVLEMIERMLDD